MRIVRGLLAAAVAVALLGSGIAESILAVTMQSYAALLTDTGREIIAPGRYDEIRELVPDRLYAVGRRTDGVLTYRLSDAEGTPAGTVVAEMLAPAGDDRVLYRIGDRIGILDAQGRILVSLRYTAAVPNGAGGLLALTSDPLDGVADELLYLDDGLTPHSTGVRVTDGLRSFSEGVMPFRDADTGRCGYLAQDGSVAIPAAYESCEAFSRGVAIAGGSDGMGLLRRDGTWCIEPEWDRIDRRGELVCAYRRADGIAELRLYDVSGTLLLSESGEGLSAQLFDGLICLRSGDEKRLLTPDGTERIRMDAGCELLEGEGGLLVLREGSFGEACESVLLKDGTPTERREQRVIPLDERCCAFCELTVRKYASTELDEVRLSVDYRNVRVGLMTAEGETLLPAEYRAVQAVGSGCYAADSGAGGVLVDATGALLWSWELYPGE